MAAKTELSVSHRSQRTPRKSSIAKPSAREVSLKKTSSSRGGSRRTDAGALLLHRLIADSAFLTDERLLEDALVERIGVSKPALRESLIWFFRSGLLIRTNEGICRDRLTPRRLNNLISARWQIERLAFRRLVEDQQCRGIADDLVSIVMQHQGLASKDSTAVEWYLRTVDGFHVEIAERADLPDLARILRSIVLQVRIGSCASLGTVTDRENAGKEHLELIAAIGKGGDWDRGWDVRLQRHLARIWMSALERLKIDSTDDLPDRWKEILSLFDGPSVDENMLHEVFMEN